MLGGFWRQAIDIKSLLYFPFVSSIDINGELTHGAYEGVRNLSSNVNFTRQSTIEGRPKEYTFLDMQSYFTATLPTNPT
jgi:hypothetical protein